MTLPTSAAERGRLQQISIDSRYTALARPSAANQPHAAAAGDQQDRRTDGRTPDRYRDPAVHTMRAPGHSN